jgi:putative ABC transport system permease protein
VLIASVRSLRRSPGFSAVAIASLGLALGLATSVFSVVDAFRHPRSIFRDADRLYHVWGSGDGAAGDVTNADRINALAGRIPAAGEIAYSAFAYFGGAQSGTRSRRVFATAVSANYFALTGMHPALGRVFSASSLDADVDHAVVISHRLWRGLFDSNEHLDRLTLTFDGRTYQVVGVAPPVLGNEAASDVWVPLAPNAMESPAVSRYITVTIRLRDGATPPELDRELHATASYLTAVHGVGRREFLYKEVPLKGDPLGLQEIHWALLAAAFAVLLIACTNLANLVLARGLVRQRDMAVRLSLGARRRDVIREILAECVVVALAGAAVGLVVGIWGVEVVASRLPDSVPFLGALAPQVSWRVIALTTVTALASAAVFGVFPALRLSDIRLSHRLQDNAGTTTGRAHGRYSALVVAQVALALSLLTGAGLMVRAAERVGHFDFGFDPTRLLTVGVVSDYRADRAADSLERASSRNPAASTAIRAAGAGSLRAMHDAVEARLRAMSGVDATSWYSGNATDGNNLTAEMISGRTREQFAQWYFVASPDLFRAMRIPMESGRDFEPGDASGDGVAIIDQALARHLWQQDDPIGRMIKTGDRESARPWFRVIGVVKTVRFGFPESPQEDDQGQLFVVSKDVPRYRTFVVRADPVRQTALSLEIERMLRDVLPPRRTGAIRHWTERYSQLLESQRFLSRLFSGFGAAALLLCALGLYSVLSYAVNQRTREYGIRMAIGARRTDVFRAVLRDGAVLVLAGTALGGFTTLWTNKLVDHFTYDLYHVDPVALIVSEAALVVVALLASAAPAWRATRANPVDVLRAV